MLPSCLLEPVWSEFHALLGDERPEFDAAHPLGCHRRRIRDRVVFEHVVAALVDGSGYERIAALWVRISPRRPGASPSARLHLRGYPPS